jgi:septal ring factor EnvC (AmiA/AmiB activator)
MIKCSKIRASAIVWCLLAFLLLPFNAFSQSKKELEDKRKKIIRDISATEKMIKKTRENKEATYDRFLALQSQINSRESLINNLQEEVAAAEEGISRNQSVIASLHQDVATMREEYGRTVRNAFRQKTISNPLLYILSAESLNHAFRRWLFLRKYDQRRREQALAIAATQEMLARKTQSLEETRAEKENLLLSMQGQKASLKGELVEKDEMLKYLSKDENRLKSDLEKKQTAHELLNRSIENIISEEVRRRVDEARSNPKPSAPTTPAPKEKPTKKALESAPKPEKSNPVVAENAPASAAVADNATLGFAKNKGRLPWPVENGFISRTFGRQQHPTLKNIVITNNGVDIRTDESAAVCAVYEGKVAGTQFIPGHDYTVIIQHGDYYTVYSNLADISLAKGDMVRSKQRIGTVSNNPITGSSELHFELWHQKERVNPSGWIKK